MKLNQLNHKVAIFSIATLALTSAGIYAHNTILSKPQNSDIGIFASTGNKVADVQFTATNPNIVNNNEGSAVRKISGSISITIPDGSKYKSGDYIEFETNYSLGNFNGRKVSVSNNGQNVEIGEMRLIENVIYADLQRGARDNTFLNINPEINGGVKQKWHIVFNDKIVDVAANSKIDLSYDNTTTSYVEANRAYSTQAAITFNGRIVAQSVVNIPITGASTFANLMHFGGVYSRINASGDDFDYINSGVWLRRSDRGNRAVQVGDTFTFTLREGVGVAFATNSRVRVGTIFKNTNQSAFSQPNQHGTWWVDKTVSSAVEITSLSPTSFTVKVTEVPSSGEFAALLGRMNFTVIDTSSNTVDRVNKKIKNIGFDIAWNSPDGSQLAKWGEVKTSDIEGATLQAQGAYIPKGTVIVQVRDEEGNKIAGIEDSYAAERVAVNSQYSAKMPAVPAGYKYTGLATGSVAQNGTVKEGVQYVKFVFTRERGSVLTKFVDQNGKEISQAGEIIKNAKYGESYTAPKEKTIAGYTFVGLAKNSAAATGKVNNTTQTVVFEYKMIDLSQQGGRLIKPIIKIGGELPEAKELIKDFDRDFAGCEVQYKEEIDTSKPGIQDAKLMISCPGQDDREITAKITIVGGEEILTIRAGDIPDAKKQIPGFDEKFPGCSARYKTQPDTSRVGLMDAIIIVECPDQEPQELEVRLNILEKESGNNEAGVSAQAPNTGAQASILPAILAGISTFSILSAIAIRKIKS